MTKIKFSDENIHQSDLKNVEGVAYSGGPVRQYWSDFPIYVDLEGMEIQNQIPILFSHYNSPTSRLGEATIENNKKTLVFNGVIDTDGDELAQEIVRKGIKIDWQVSIGADVLAMEELRDGETIEVNGNNVTGPVTIVKKSLLREISVVAVGADSDTNMKIMASLDLNKKGKNVMENIENAKNKELEKIKELKQIAAEYPDILEKAIKFDWTKEQTEETVKTIQDFKKQHDATMGNIIVHSGHDVSEKTLEAALSLSAGISAETIAKDCGAQELEFAEKNLRGFGIRDLFIKCAEKNSSYVAGSFSNETIRAGYSTAKITGILSNVANKRALQAFNMQESIAEKVCSAGDLNDFKVSERYRLNEGGDLDVVTDGGKIKSGVLTEDRATNQLKTYGKLFTLTRQMIYNDDLGEFLKIPVAMGMKAKKKIDQVFFTRLLENPAQGDTENLFSTAHKNYMNGADSALSVESLEKLIGMFMDQTDSAGDPIDVSPKYLIVPTALYALAQRLTMSQYLIGTTTKAVPALNVLSNYNIQVIASPYLSNTKYTNASSTGFYLFADPAQVDTFEIGYFRGNRTPIVEQGETDFNTLGTAFRVYFDFGIREQDFRGMAFSKGAA